MHRRVSLKKPWLVGVFIAVLIAGHGIFFYSTYSRWGLMTFLGILAVLLLKHVGLLGPAYAFFKRQFHH